MNAFAVALASRFVRVGCASPPPMPPADDLFSDALFAPPAVPIELGKAMALSASMRTYP